MIFLTFINVLNIADAVVRYDWKMNLICKFSAAQSLQGDALSTTVRAL